MSALLIAALAGTLQAGAGAGEEPIRIESAMPKPELLRRSAPEYPAEAHRVGMEGVVMVECVVDARGRVSGAKALRGDAPLSAAAVKAVKKWHYRPFLVDGKAKSFVLTVQVNFEWPEPTLKASDLFEGLTSRYEAVREAAATSLGYFGPGPPGHQSRDFVWAKRDLKKLLEHEQSARVRVAAEKALALIEAQ